MTIDILVIDDELGRLPHKREEFLRRWDLFPDRGFGTELKFTFITSQHNDGTRITNDASIAVAHLAKNPELWSLVLLDMQFDHGLLIKSEPLEADARFGLRIQSILEREVPGLPIVHFTAQAQAELGHQDGVYLSKIDGTADDLRLLLVEHGRVSLHDKARLLKVPDDTIVASDSTIALYAAVFRRAKADTPLLIRGETGTGKEHLARYVHAVSRRTGAPWVALQVSSLPAGLYESELFGHEKGAFTGAERQHPGAFTRAEDGTLFLDEIGSLTPELQAKLLRVLGERTFRRVGGSTDIKAQCAVVAATQDDLEGNGFREDLLARFSEVTVPPLRERPEELLLLAEHFLNLAQVRQGKRGIVLSASAREALTRATFPDNARGLRRAMENAVLSLSSNSVVQPSHLGSQVASSKRTVNRAAAPEAPPLALPTSSPGAHGLAVAVDQMAHALAPNRPEDLRGALAELESAVARAHRSLALAALRACRHPVTQKPKVLPAMQLLLGNKDLTTMQAKRKLNELLGRNQNEALGEEWLRDLCERDAEGDSSHIKNDARGEDP